MVDCIRMVMSPDLYAYSLSRSAGVGSDILHLHEAGLPLSSLSERFPLLHTNCVLCH